MLLSPGADMFNARSIYIMRICLKPAARIAVWLADFDAVSSKEVLTALGECMWIYDSET
jgi:hypothetical protein